MTPEQRERTLEEKARIDELRANFEAYKQERIEQDQKQEIGRHYDLKFDFSKDLSKQVNEKFERIDREFDKDQDALERQNLQERKDFDDWMKTQREELRAGDITQNPDKAQPRLVPGFDRGKGDPTYSTQFDKDYAQMEKMRDAETEQIRREFHEFQDNQHADRLEKLNDRNDANHTQLSKAEDYMQPLPWESGTETQERAQRAIEQLEKQQQEERARTKDKDFNR